MIPFVRRVLNGALGLARLPALPALSAVSTESTSEPRSDTDRRLEAAHRRLKATIPPPAD